MSLPRVAADGQVATLMQINLVAQRNLDRAIVDRSLDVAIISYGILILIVGSIAANLQRIVELLGDRRSRAIIADEFQAIISVATSWVT